MKKAKKWVAGLLTLGLLGSVCVAGNAGTTEAATSGWKKAGNKWWYSYSNGSYPKNKWEKLGGKWYHFDKAGYMQTGWKKISGKWYYFGSNGIMRTGWKKISGKWYYFENTGSMVTGTKTIKGTSYTFDKNGVWTGDSSGGSSSGSDASSAKVGDIIKFGTYEQDGNKSNGKEAIEWQVLDKKDGKLFVVSKYALDYQPFNKVYDTIPWEKCSLRSWLNNTFINTAFTSAEKNKIQTTKVVNEDNPYWGSDGGKDTQDKVFLLSISEAAKYFGLKSNPESESLYPYYGDACTTKPTKWAAGQITQDEYYKYFKQFYYSDLVDAYKGWYGDDYESAMEYEIKYHHLTGNRKKYDGNCSYLLRSPGDFEKGDCAFVDFSGNVDISGWGMANGLFIRPAMWITP